LVVLDMDGARTITACPDLAGTSWASSADAQAGTVSAEADADADADAVAWVRGSGALPGRGPGGAAARDAGEDDDSGDADAIVAPAQPAVRMARAASEDVPTISRPQFGDIGGVTALTPIPAGRN
jgi:hypothetical protein